MMSKLTDDELPLKAVADHLCDEIDSW
jgi:hypothetical protein